MGLERLDKILSSQLGISRKEVKAAVRKGRARINGTAAADPGQQADPERNMITFDGQAVTYKKFVYILMNKPKGILSASNDKSRKTVIDLVPQELKRSGLFPAGRLDRDTTGLLIITDDGAFAHRMLAPKSGVFKTYRAVLDGEITDDTVRKFEKGVTLADGTLCRPARLFLLDGNTAEIRICEGRYHQIKRMFGACGLGVNELERISIGNLVLPADLLPGECTELDKSCLETVFCDIL